MSHNHHTWCGHVADAFYLFTEEWGTWLVGRHSFSANCPLNKSHHHFVLSSIFNISHGYRYSYFRKVAWAISVGSTETTTVCPAEIWGAHPTGEHNCFQVAKVCVFHHISSLIYTETFFPRFFLVYLWVLIHSKRCPWPLPTCPSRKLGMSSCYLFSYN